MNRIDNKPIIESTNNLNFSFLLNPTYFRALLLSAEDFYINNNLEKCIDILYWLLSIENYLKENTVTNLLKPSVYYDLFEINELKPFFSKSNIYLNQIKQGNDFFGNSTKLCNLT